MVHRIVPDRISRERHIDTSEAFDYMEAALTTEYTDGFQALASHAACLNGFSLGDFAWRFTSSDTSATKINRRTVGKGNRRPRTARSCRSPAVSGWLRGT